MEGKNQPPTGPDGSSGELIFPDAQPTRDFYEIAQRGIMMLLSETSSAPKKSLPKQ